MKNYPTNYPRPNPERFDGARLKEHRNAAGLSQYQLADRARVTPNSVWRWEAGRMRPSGATALGLAAILGISVEELYS